MIIAYYNLDNEKVAQVEYKDGKLTGLDDAGKFMVESALGGVPEENMEKAIEHFVETARLEQRSYLTPVIEQED